VAAIALKVLNYQRIKVSKSIEIEAMSCEYNATSCYFLRRAFLSVVFIFRTVPFDVHGPHMQLECCQKSIHHGPEHAHLSTSLNLFIYITKASYKCAGN